MSKRCIAAALASSAILLAAPAFADGEILITHARALAGNVTPGDTPGYPVTISIPGTFQLASNLFVAVNQIGIQVTANNVTIDLNGFLMEGSDVAWYGIAGGVDGVTIRNGTITRFEYDGIVGTGDDWMVKDMRVTQNGRYGVSCAIGCRVEGAIIRRNASIGIRFTGTGTVVGSTISSNGGYGVDAAGNFSAIGSSTILGNNGGFATDQINGSILFLDPNACSNC